MAAAQRIYAQALYEAAQAQESVDAARDELAELATALEQSPELESFLANPQLDPASKSDVLDEITTGAAPVVRNFVRVVAAKGRAGQLRQIADEFEAIVDREQGRLKVELTTAYELDDDEATALLGPVTEDLAAAGIQVLWPRDLVRPLQVSASVTPAAPADASNAFFGFDQLMELRFTISLDGEVLTDAELDALLAPERMTTRAK